MHKPNYETKGVKDIQIKIVSKYYSGMEYYVYRSFTVMTLSRDLKPKVNTNLTEKLIKFLMSYFKIQYIKFIKKYIIVCRSG